jgi:hypothetical protein
MMAENWLTVTSKLRRTIAWVILSSLWLVAACAPGGGYGPPRSSAYWTPPSPAYSYPYNNPDYYPPNNHSDYAPDLP